MKPVFRSSSYVVFCLAIIAAPVAKTAQTAPAANQSELPEGSGAGVAPTARAETVEGYLVVEVERLAYSFKERSVDKSTKRVLKIPVSEAFRARFKNVPSQKSRGTGFFIGASTVPAGVMKGTRFLWWIRRTTDDRWQITMWGVGAESIDGKQVQAMNPGRSTGLVVRRWDDLDMYHQISYRGESHRVNATFSLRYRAAGDADLDGIPTLAIPAGKERAVIMDPPDEEGGTTEGISCGFQED